MANKLCIWKLWTGITLLLFKLEIKDFGIALTGIEVIKKNANARPLATTMKAKGAKKQFLQDVQNPTS